MQCASSQPRSVKVRFRFYVFITGRLGSKHIIKFILKSNTD